MGKKLLSLLFAVVLLCTVLPMTALAADDAYVGRPTTASVDVAVGTGGWEFKVSYGEGVKELKVDGVPKKSGDTIGTLSMTNLNRTKHFVFDAVFNTAESHTITVTAHKTSGVIPADDVVKSVTVVVQPCMHEADLDHVLDEGKEATCLEPGVVKQFQCKYCDAVVDENGKVVTDTVISAKQHSFGDKVLTAQVGTCTTEAMDDCWQCANCNLYFASNADWFSSQGFETMDSFKHGKNMTNHVGVRTDVSGDPPTCKDPGHDPYWVCSGPNGCGWCFAMNDEAGATPKYSNEFNLDANPDAHVRGKLVTGTTATCNQKGKLDYYKCQVEGCKAWLDENGHVLKDAEGNVLTSLKTPEDPNNHSEDNLEPYPSKESNCVEQGNIEYWFCNGCEKLLKKDDNGNFVLTDAEDIKLPVDETKHVKGFVGEASEQEATCSTQGHAAYWQCEKCKKFFAADDEDGSKGEIAQELCLDHYDPTNHSDIQPFDKVPSTCKTPGTDACWFCHGCNTLLKKDENGNFVEAKQEELALPLDPQNHDPEHVYANLGGVATCVTEGNSAYWKCNDCEKFFADEAMTKEIKDPTGLLPHKDPTNHPEGMFEHQDEIKATCFAEGWDGYWYCSACKKYFAEDDLNTPIDKKGTFKRPMLEHKWEAGEMDSGVEYEYCSECGFYRLADGSIVEGIPSMHTLDYVQGFPATCTEDGEWDRWVCTDEGCGLMFTDLNATTILKSAVIPATNHQGTLKPVEHVNKCWVCTACGMYFSDAKGTKPMEQPGDVDKHALVYHGEETPNCQTGNGHGEYWECVACGDLYDSVDGTNMTSLNKVLIPYRANNPEHHHVVKIPATKEHIEYWECQDCGMCFDGDQNGAKVLDPSEVGKTETVADHSLKFQPEVPATCTTNGTKAHWLCLSSHNCGKYFADSLAKTALTKADLVIPAGHKYVHFKGTAADMDNEGRKGYDYCSVCGLVRLDDSESWITMDEAMKSWGIDKAPDRGNPEPKKKIPATCTSTGVKKHWEVEDLRNHVILYFLDEAMTQQVDKDALTIPMIAHTLYPVAETDGSFAYYKCLVCEQCFDNDHPGAGSSGGGAGDFVKPTEPPAPTETIPEGVIKDNLDLSGMGLSTNGNKYNAP